MSTAKSAVTVLGAGSYGTALAICFARNGHQVTLWGRNSEHVEALAAERKNQRYLPDIQFPNTLELEADLETAVKSSERILVVVPSHAFADTLKKIKPMLLENAKVAWATKGLEPNTGRLLQEVALDVLGDDVPLAVLSGPTFAKEMAAGLPTAISVSSICAKFREELAELLHCGRSFRCIATKTLLVFSSAARSKMLSQLARACLTVLVLVRMLERRLSPEDSLNFVV